MRELVGAVGPHAEPLGRETEVRVPAQALLAPVLEPRIVVTGPHEELELHLLELARAEEEVAGRDLVAEGLSNLCDAEGNLETRSLDHVPEVDEDALRRLRPEVGDVCRVLHGADEGLEHQVELARLGELAATRRARRALEVVGTETLLAVPAVDERIGEAREMPGGFPHGGMHDEGGVDPDDVVATGHDRAPPRVLDVALQLDAERPVVEARTEAPVYLTAGKDEPPPLAEVQDLRRPHGGHGARRLPPAGDGAGHLRQLPERGRDVASQDSLRHRADWKVLPQRDHARQLPLPHARVRADGARVLRAAR